MDAQAQDRCHRIGQTREVHIYRLVRCGVSPAFHLQLTALFTCKIIHLPCVALFTFIYLPCIACYCLVRRVDRWPVPAHATDL